MRTSDDWQRLQPILARACDVATSPAPYRGHRFTSEEVQHALALTKDRLAAAGRIETGRILDALATALQVALPPADTLRHYYSALEDLPADILQDAARELRDTWKYPRFPAIADIKALGSSRMARRKLAYAGLKKMSGAVSRPSDTLPRDEKLKRIDDIMRKAGFRK